MDTAILTQREKVCTWIEREVSSLAIDSPLHTRFTQALRELANLPVPRESSLDIALVGGTGVGKSTLINKLLGEHVVPTSADSISCTNCNVSISNVPSMGESIRAVVQYRTREEWQNLVALLLDPKSPNYENHKWMEVKKNACLRAVYRKKELLGLVTQSQARQAPQDNQAPPPPIRFPENNELEEIFALPRGCKEEEMKSFDDLREFLEAVSVRPQGAEEFQTTFTAWPLVKAVHVYANFPQGILPQFATLHDTPGDNDIDGKRMVGNEFNSFITGMDSVWFLCKQDDRPASSRLVAQSLRELQTEGVLAQTRFVLTKCDAIADIGPDFEARNNNIIRGKIRQLLVDDDDDDDDDEDGALDEDKEALLQQIQFSWISSIKGYGMEPLKQFVREQAKLRLSTIQTELHRVDDIQRECEEYLRTFKLYNDDVVAQLSRDVEKNLQQRLNVVHRDIARQLTKRVNQSLNALRDPKLVRRTSTLVRERVLAEFGSLHYRTLQSIMARQGSWRPSLPALVTLCVLQESGLEAIWTTLFDTSLQALVRECRTEYALVSKSLAKELSQQYEALLPPEQVRDVQTKVDASGQAFRRHMDDTMQLARQGLQNVVSEDVWLHLQRSNVYDAHQGGKGCKERMASHLVEQSTAAVPAICASLCTMLQTKVRRAMREPTTGHLHTWGSTVKRAFRALFGNDMRQRQKQLMNTKQGQLADQLSELSKHLGLVSLGPDAAGEGGGSGPKDREPDVWCMVCMEDVPATDIFGAAQLRTTSPPPGCPELHKVCNDCIVGHTCAKLDSRVFPVCCPGISCGYELQPHLVLPLLKREDQQRALEASIQRWLNSNPTVHCPHPDCTVSVEVSASALLTEQFAKVTCQGCDRAWCMRCKVAWHTDQTCAEYARGAQAQREFETVLAADPTVKKCPNCGLGISKTMACNHMTCERKLGGCGTHFCNLCSRRLDARNPYLHFRRGAGACGGKLGLGNDA